jgi:hypothetical protein
MSDRTLHADGRDGGRPGAWLGRRAAGTGPQPRIRGLTVVELMVGLAAGSLVVAAALAMLAPPLRAAAAAERDARAAEDLQASQRLLAQWLRQAVPAPAGGTGPALADGDATLTFHTIGDDGRVRRVAWRIAEGRLAVRLEGGGWQAVTDDRALVVEAGRFRLPGWNAGGCNAGAPLVGWTFDVRPAGFPEMPWRRIDGLAQVRHPWPLEPGCAP